MYGSVFSFLFVCLGKIIKISVSAVIFFFLLCCHMMCCTSREKQIRIFILKQTILSHASRKPGQSFCVYFSCYDDYNDHFFHMKSLMDGLKQPCFFEHLIVISLATTWILSFLSFFCASSRGVCLHLLCIILLGS